MRLDAEWMTQADERILELLRDDGPKSPKEITDHPRMRWSRQHVGNRCRKLHSYGMLEKHGRGVYAINRTGLDFLNEELDAKTLESDRL